MASVQPTVSEQGPAPGVNTNLSSNNPFRRAASPPSTPPDISSSDASNAARPVSRNPFLDDYNLENKVYSPQTENSPQKAMAAVEEQPRQLPTMEPPNELMNGLALRERSDSNRNRRYGPPRPRNGPIPRHRVTRSEEEDGARNSNAPLIPRKKEGPPPKGSENRENARPRQRRNSDSSVITTDDDPKRSDGHHKERGGHKPGKSGSRRDFKIKPKRPNPRVDLIDKLDVTGIYGVGFHHDGPFDACNPHRNRKGMKGAPMQAFPEGSANNVLGGSGPVNKGLDLDRIHGRMAEGFTDYNTGGRRPDPYEAARRANADRPYVLDARAAAEQVHGEASAGLGTSTFLEGAPAPRRELTQREAEAEAAATAAPTLQRKKSIVQKIRGMSKSRPGYGEPGFMSPDARYVLSEGSPVSPDAIQTAPVGPTSAGGRGKTSEINPFFADLDKTTSHDGVPAAEPEEDNFAMGVRDRAPSSPSRGLMRRVTSDGTGDVEQKTGFISRVKSLKGGKRTRPERSGSGTAI